MNPKSILVIGATGRTGSHLIQAISKSTDNNDNWNPSVAALCRNPLKFDSKTKSLCSMVLQGDATNEFDLQNALTESKADLVMVSVGNGDNLSKTDIRTSSAKALTNVLTKPGFKHVKVLVISSNGAGESRIKVGFGIGRLIEFQLRHILKDHDGQEAAFFASEMKGRTMILRPTALVEGENGGTIALFGDQDKPSSHRTDRQDLAEWAVNQIVTESNVAFGSEPVNITCTEVI